MATRRAEVRHWAEDRSAKVRTDAEEPGKDGFRTRVGEQDEEDEVKRIVGAYIRPLGVMLRDLALPCHHIHERLDWSPSALLPPV